jgi:hypothetical protein
VGTSCDTGSVCKRHNAAFWRCVDNGGAGAEVLGKWEQCGGTGGWRCSRFSGVAQGLLLLAAVDQRSAVTAQGCRTGRRG